MKTKRNFYVAILVILLLLVGCAKEGKDVVGVNEQSVTPEPADNQESIEIEENIDREPEEAEKTEVAEEMEVPITPQEDVENDNPRERGGSSIDLFIANMTLEEKIAQMFIVLPEALVGVDTVTSAGEATRNALEKRPVGGFIYMEGNLQSPEEVSDMLRNLQSYSMERVNLPMFTTIDEEGGTVARINGKSGFDVPYIGDMSEIGQTGDINRAYEVGVQIGTYLSELGFNVNFAPDADVLSNTENQVVRKRSFGNNPEMVTNMALAVLEGLQSQGVHGTFKHFPGHGATAGDTHEGYAYTNKSLEELKSYEMIPFEAGIAQNVPFIMVGHISVPTVIGDNTPSSLSHTMITEVLREQMGYDGIVITDAMNMGAIVKSYSSSEAAIRTIKAGTDIVLMPADFESAYQGVLQAVKEGTISSERIDESLRRILKVKIAMMD